MLPANFIEGRQSVKEITCDLIQVARAGASRMGRDGRCGSGGRCEPHGQRWERWEKYSFYLPQSQRGLTAGYVKYEFSRNKDYKGLFTLHYLTNFHLTMNYFVNMLCYKAVNQCSVISN